MLPVSYEKCEENTSLSYTFTTDLLSKALHNSFWGHILVTEMIIHPQFYIHTPNISNNLLLHGRQKIWTKQALC